MLLDIVFSVSDRRPRATRPLADFKTLRSRGTHGKFPYSESLQSLRAKRSISHEHQKSFHLSPDFPPQHTVTRSATSAPVEPSSPGVRPSHCPLGRCECRACGSTSSSQIVIVMRYVSGS